MKRVKYIAYRYLTPAEFFNMYKPRGTEPGGGGQKYVDFPKSAVRITQWRNFFSGVIDLRGEQRTQGPSWTIPIYSIGITPTDSPQTVTVFQRRSASVCIAAQHIHARRGNRILSWHPDNSFPEPQDPRDRHQLPRGLAVYLHRTYENEVWAGWFRNDSGFPSPYADTAAEDLLQPTMLRGNQAGKVGFLTFNDGELWLNETNQQSPFTAAREPSTGGMRVAEPKREPYVVTPQEEEEPADTGTRVSRPSRASRWRQRSDDEIIADLFDEDEETETALEDDEHRAKVSVRRRNERAVRYLKELYQQCQITGTDYIFRKNNGEFYTEAHHLIPLGAGGADDPRNIIIVGPLVHRMLHYATVSRIDLSEIQQHEDGTATLAIQINGEDYTIRWHPGHADKVLEQQEANSD